jgi:hypothetical protein
VGGTFQFRHIGALLFALTAVVSCGRVGYDDELEREADDGAFEGAAGTEAATDDAHSSTEAATHDVSTEGGAIQDSPSDLALEGTQNLDASDAPGCPGLAASLDGTAYATVVRMVQDDFTIEAWIRTTTLLSGTGAWDGAPIFFADVPGTVADDFSMSILDGVLAFTVGNPDTTVRSNTFVATGQWTHVAATRSKQTGIVQVLVNGAPEVSTVGNKNSLTSSASMQLGGTPFNRFFVGQMDEIRVWTIVRSASDIASTMHRTLTGNEPGLILYWRFEEGSGRVVFDSSPARNDGAVNATFAWAPSTAPTCQ